MSLATRVRSVNSRGDLTTHVNMDTLQLSQDAKVCVTRHNVDICPVWSDVQFFFGAFTDQTEARWKNNRGLCHELRQVSIDESDLSVVQSLLRAWHFHPIQPLESDQYCESVMFKVLDFAFMQFITETYEHLAMLSTWPSSRDRHLVHAYLVQKYHYHQSMAAVSRWFRSRRADASFSYAMVLSSMHDVLHECSACHRENMCQPEHICCRDYHIRMNQQMGWDEMPSSNPNSVSKPMSSPKPWE